MGSKEMLIDKLVGEGCSMAGIERLKGHELMGIERFEDGTRHMIII